jgi:hypothetical protein
MPAAASVNTSITAINARELPPVGAAATSKNPGWSLTASAPGTDVRGGWLELLPVPSVGVVGDAGIELRPRGDTGTEVAGHAGADAGASVCVGCGAADVTWRVCAQVPGAGCR